MTVHRAGPVRHPTLALRSVRPPYIMAHRGNRHACPENTLAAFRRAIADGADIVETDLHVTRDGAFVCIHDGTLDRTTDGRGAVREHTLRDLKRLSASAGFPGYREERIPTVAELASLIPPDVALALELKSDSFLDAGVCGELADLLSALGLRGRTMILSFNQRRVRAFRAVAPDVPTGLVSIHSVLPPRRAEFVGPHWPLLFLNPLYVQIAQRRGQLVCPLDPLPEPRLRYYLALGVDALLTDDPAATIAALRDIRRHIPISIDDRSAEK